jgi:hypothetical protein
MVFQHTCNKYSMNRIHEEKKVGSMPVSPTQRVFDWWESARFQAVNVA